MCDRCEKHLNKWETCAANWLYNWEPDVVIKCEAGIIYEQIRYHEFRLYCLSVLWRMSISKFDYFRLVALGDALEEKLRLALLNEDTLDGLYPVGLTKIVSPNGSDIAFSMQPFRGCPEQGESYHLLTNGFLHDFWIDGYEESSAILHSCLTRDGTMSVPVFSYFEHPKIAEVMRGQIDKFCSNGQQLQEERPLL